MIYSSIFYLTIGLYRTDLHKILRLLLSVGENAQFVFTARRYASAVYAVVVCPSVCLSDFKRILVHFRHDFASFWVPK